MSCPTCRAVFAKIPFLVLKTLCMFLLDPILGEDFLPMSGQHIFQIELVDVETHQLLEKIHTLP